MNAFKPEAFKPASVDSWREQQRKARRGHHGINAYHCEKCGRNTVTIDVDPGVTPMFLACRRTPGCDGTAVSSGYPDAQPPKHITDALQWEWALPSPKKVRRLDPAMREHVENGGLVLQPWSGRPSAYLANGGAS